MLDAAIRLYHKREREGTKQWLEAMNNPFNDKPYEYEQNNATKIWFWGLNRWGGAWSNREYELRSNERE